MGIRDNNCRRGFSLVEVMVAMVVFMIAALGLAALHKVSMNAASSGRERTSANNLAQHAMVWLQAEAGAFAEGQPQTDYPVIDVGLTNLGEWQQLGTEATFRYDEHFGNSFETIYTGGVDSAKFCVDYMLARLTSSATAANPGNEPIVLNLIQASVRVTWPKYGAYTATWKDCTSRTAVLNPDLPAEDDFHQMVLTQFITTDFANKI